MEIQNKSLKVRLVLALFAMLMFNTISGQNAWKHGALKVSANGHYLQYEDGTPFF